MTTEFRFYWITPTSLSKPSHGSLVMFDIGWFFYDGWKGSKDAWIQAVVLGFGFCFAYERYE